MIDRRQRWTPGRTILVVGILVWATGAVAQELDARAYANAPVGVNFFGSGATFSTGGIVLDSSIPVENLDSDVVSLTFFYTRTLGVGGRLAKLKFVLPAASAEWRGNLIGEGPRSREVTGTGDAKVTFEVNLLGSPALEVREFAKYRQKTIVGASVEIKAPTGQYDSSKLFNLGLNRWSFAGEVAVSHAVGKWVVEGAATAWFFTANDEFLGDSTLEQDPLFALQLNAIYTFRPGFWLGFGTGVADGGQNSLNGVELANEGVNSRTGIRLAYPLAPRHGLVFDLSTGLTTRLGADYDSLTVAYQYMWFRKKDAPR